VLNAIIEIKRAGITKEIEAFLKHATKFLNSGANDVKQSNL
jgi:hypothetical protein